VSKRQRKSANFEEVLAKLQAAAADAVTVLHAGLFEGPPSTRIRAALAIVKLGITFAEVRNLESRLSMLELRKWK
jgi:hypothetical protein